MVSQRRRRMRLPGKLAWTCRNWRRLPQRRANIWPRRSRRKAEAPLRFWLKVFPKELSVDLLAEEYVLAQAKANALCGQCAGWWRCSTAKRFRWSLTASGQETISRGHRILAGEDVTIPRAGSAYVDALRAAKVLGRGEREQQIRKALDAATRTIPGARWREDKSLLDTRGEPHGISVRDSGRIRSAVSGAAGRSSGHGDARSSEIFCAGRCEQASCCRIFWRC